MATCIDKGVDSVKSEQEVIRRHVETIAEVAATLDPGTSPCARREADYQKILARIEGDGDAVHEHMAKLMTGFRVGLFVGGDTMAQVQDNLELERWFRLPKSHERRIHGRRHAGVRIVQKGRRWCWPWMPITLTRGRSPSRNSLRIVGRVNPRANVKRWVGARS